MEKLSDRLALVMERAKLKNQTQLAKAAGVKPPSVTHWMNGNTKTLDILPATNLAALSGLNALWISRNEGPQWQTDERENVESGPLIRGAVPLINSVQAGNYVCFVDNHHPGDGGMEMIVTSAPVGKHTYALKVSGDSMEPEFTDGQILIIEPELEPMPGDFVIARLVDGEETTFKQLVKDGPEWFLKPLNDRYPIRPLGNATIVGVLRAVEKRYR